MTDILARCSCPCHRSIRKAPWPSAVEMRDPIESVTACDLCVLLHDEARLKYPPPTQWTPLSDATGSGEGPEA